MDRETKWVGWFALTLGGVGILEGVRTLVDGFTPAEVSYCRAFCGLALLATELFGAGAGTLVGGLLWLAAGAVFCWFGYRVLKG
ncbi:hypothetical protein [Roseateles sp. LYH14W]|uniref:QacE family quaternary ammonium compound efflux SMR transporter n=1 Tax=Pelomonas parva TaxID=3299032 RepID=A0ABW7F0A8_9BURK